MTEWNVAPMQMDPAAGEVDIYYVPLNRIDRRTFFKHWMLLSTDEHGRAQRFLREVDRVQFVQARGTLRRILSRYLGATPDEIRFEYGPNGKPRLADDHASTLAFNLAHSGSVMVLAVGWDRQIGVDVEHIEPKLDVAHTSNQFLTHAERRCLESLPADQQRRAFFATWTRKEAYLKATGSGFQLSADEIEVSVLPWEPTALIRSPYPGHVFGWTISDLPLHDGYVGAIAVGAPSTDLRYWRLGATLNLSP